MDRRRYLAVSAAGLLGLAGCSALEGSDTTDGQGTDSTTESQGTDGSSTDTGRADAGSEGASADVPDWRLWIPSDSVTVEGRNGIMMDTNQAKAEMSPSTYEETGIPKIATGLGVYESDLERLVGTQSDQKSNLALTGSYDVDSIVDRLEQGETTAETYGEYEDLSFDATKIGVRFDGSDGESLTSQLYIYFPSASEAETSTDLIERELNNSDGVSGEYRIQSVEQDGNRLVVDATVETLGFD